MKRRPAGEFELIERFTQHFERTSPAIELGIGDDCALLRLPPRHDLAATTDAIVEGVHFSNAFAPADIGHKALAVNLSDLAAMGAAPLGFLCAIELPAARVSDLAGMARGMARLARQHQIPLVGGNLTRARALAITITALGTVSPSQALRRGGARIGDLLFVSGELGGAARGLRPGAPPACLRRQRRPEPRLALGRAVRPWARAAIDISDGLLQDLGHLLRASQVAAEIDGGALPVQSGATLQDALGGGEDYELLIAVSPPHQARFRRAARATGLRTTRIGTCVRGPVGAIAVDGRPTRAGQRGHDHFASR